jgi:hypothetical protein
MTIRAVAPVRAPVLRGVPSKVAGAADEVAVLSTEVARSSAVAEGVGVPGESEA